LRELIDEIMSYTDPGAEVKLFPASHATLIKASAIYDYCFGKISKWEMFRRIHLDTVLPSKAMLAYLSKQQFKEGEYWSAWDTVVTRCKTCRDEVKVEDLEQGQCWECRSHDAYIKNIDDEEAEWKNPTHPQSRAFKRQFSKLCKASKIELDQAEYYYRNIILNGWLTPELLAKLPNCNYEQIQTIYKDLGLKNPRKEHGRIFATRALNNEALKHQFVLATVEPVDASIADILIGMGLVNSTNLYTMAEKTAANLIQLAQL
jgi:hypothetical protein